VNALHKPGWLYLIEDSQGNLKIGFSANWRQRIYDYRNTVPGQSMPKSPAMDGVFWYLGIMPGTSEEERSFHAEHRPEAICTEWYPPNSRAWCRLLLMPWGEPDKTEPVRWWGEGPLYAMVHRKSLSQIASLLSRSRKSKRGTAKVLRPCPKCKGQFGALELRKHIPKCEFS